MLDNKLGGCMSYLCFVCSPLSANYSINKLSWPLSAPGHVIRYHEIWSLTKLLQLQYWKKSLLEKIWHILQLKGIMSMITHLKYAWGFILKSATISVLMNLVELLSKFTNLRSTCTNFELQSSLPCFSNTRSKTH